MFKKRIHFEFSLPNANWETEDLEPPSAKVIWDFHKSEDCGFNSNDKYDTKNEYEGELEPSTYYSNEFGSRQCRCTNGREANEPTSPLSEKDSGVSSLQESPVKKPPHNMLPSALDKKQKIELFPFLNSSSDNYLHPPFPLRHLQGLPTLGTRHHHQDKTKTMGHILPQQRSSLSPISDSQLFLSYEPGVHQKDVPRVKESRKPFKVRVEAPSQSQNTSTKCQQNSGIQPTGNSQSLKGTLRRQETLGMLPMLENQLTHFAQKKDDNHTPLLRCSSFKETLPTNNLLKLYHKYSERRSLPQMSICKESFDVNYKREDVSKEKGKCMMSLYSGQDRRHNCARQEFTSEAVDGATCNSSLSGGNYVSIVSHGKITLTPKPYHLQPPGVLVHNATRGAFPPPRRSVQDKNTSPRDIKSKLVRNTFAEPLLLRAKSALTAHPDMERSKSPSSHSLNVLTCLPTAKAYSIADMKSSDKGSSVARPTLNAQTFKY